MMDFAKQIAKVIILTAIIAGIFFYFYRPIPPLVVPKKRPEDFGIDQKKIDDYLQQAVENENEEVNTSIKEDNISVQPYLPSTHNQILEKRAFYISYNSKAKIADWVSYVLTKQIIVKSNYSRTGYFEQDPEVQGGQASYYDFSSSGYIRGHLVPVADVSYDLDAMKESFLLSNIAPMKSEFNEGIWLELEEVVRDWAYTYQTIYITSGPIIDGDAKRIGKGKITAPTSYFKAVWVQDEVRPRAIAFVIPNEKSLRPLQDYIVSVNDLEFMLGHDIFSNIVADEQEHAIEAKVDDTIWRWSDSRFQRRISK